MPNCTSCGSEIPDGQGKSCSMCYGDIDYGRDGYYREWAEQQDRKKASEDPGEMVSSCCGASPKNFNNDSDSTDIGICPACKEHCDWVSG